MTRFVTNTLCFFFTITYSAMTFAILAPDSEPNNTLETATPVTLVETHPDLIVVDWSGTITRSNSGGATDIQDNVSFSLQQGDVVLLSKRVRYSDESVNNLADTELIGPLPSASVFLDGGPSRGTIQRIDETGTWYLQASTQGTNGVFGYGIGFVVARGNVDIVHSGDQPSPVRRQNTVLANEFSLKPQFGVVGADTDKNPIANVLGIYLEAGEVLSLTLDTSAGLLSPLVTVKSPDGSLLDSGTNALASVAAPVSGYYQVEVTADDSTSDLTIQGGQGPRGYYYATGTISSPHGNIVGEIEPNNSVSEATAINLTSIQGGSGNVLTGRAIGNIEGQFTGDFDRTVDWYSIELQAGDRVDFSTTKFNGIDIKLQMLDENQISFILHNTSTNVNTYSVPVSGTYYLLAELTNASFGNSSHYGFNVLVTRDAWIEQPGRNTIIPRENLVGAGPLDYRLRPVTGFIEASLTTLDPLAHDLNIYLEAGEMLTGLSVNVGQGTLLPRLKLADPAGVEVATGTSSLTDYTALTSGLYQLMLDSQDTVVGSGNEGGQGYRAFYELTGSIRATRSNLVADTEPNDLTSQATPLRLEAINDGTLLSGSAIGQIQGQFTGDQDRTSDWYSVDLQAGDRIDIVVSRLGGSVGIKVRMLNETQISFVQTDTSSNINTYVVPVNGTYFLSTEMLNTSSGFSTHYGLNVLVSRDAWVEQAGRNTIIPREALPSGGIQDFRLKPVAGTIDASASSLDPLAHSHQFYLEQGEKLNLNVNSNFGTLKPRLTLSDPAASEVASGTDTIVDYIASATGLYKIEVSSQDLTTGVGDEGGQGYRATYELSGSIVAVATNLVAEMEPNDQIAEATPTLLISDGSGGRSGLVYGQIEGQFSGNANRSADHFELDLMAGESVTFASSLLGGNVSTRSTLLSSTGSTVALGSPTQGGIHYLQVTLASSSSGFFAAYEVAITALGPDTDGDGALDAIDTDDDNDGVLDGDDAFPLDATETLDTDADGTGNNADTDDDNDGVVDVDDAFPLMASESVDTDGDGTGNNADTDDDNDGVLDADDAFPLMASESVDTDGDGTGNNADTDDDNDSVLDADDAFPLMASESVDTDGDGTGNNADTDDDNDGVLDADDAFPLMASESVDTDGDGTGNNADVDDDGDGVADVDDAFPLIASESMDTDGDGTGNNADTDDDNDGVLDADDAFPLMASESVDTDGDGTGNNADTDDDNDGVADVDDAFPLDPARSVDAINSAPMIAIEGAATFTLNVGQTFNDPGVLAVDTEDGDLTESVIVSDDVNNTVPGSYTVEYRVTDSGGLTAMVSRTVIVIEPLSSGAIRFTAGQVIELPVIGTALTAPNGDALVVPTSATAASINVTAVTPGASGFMTVWPCGVERPLASNLNYVAGDVVPNGVLAPIGSNGKVCFYSQADTDLVVDVAGWFEGDAFVGATPLRLRDTRETSRVTPTEALVLQVADIAASTADGTATVIPADVGAVALNVTVVSPDSAGFVTVYPCGARPLASNVNYTAGQIVPNGVIAPVSPSGEVCIYSLVPTDVVVDLAGWFPGAAFTAATPQRLVDTRDGTGGQQGKLTPAGQLSVSVHGEMLSVAGNSAQVPLSATAAALNVTIVNPEGSGFATVWPCSAERPLASNLNFVSGQVVANNVIAPIGDQGNVCFYTNVPSDIIVDIAGYFSGETGNQFVGSTPKRYIDTRSSLGPAPQ